MLVRTRGGLTRLTYRHHPFDVVGWDGCLYPYAFNIADFEPIVGRIHAPPPVHQTFEGPNFVICSFCPGRSTSTRSGAGALQPPNVDSDEVMFYAGGDYSARRGRASGSARSRCTRPGSSMARNRAPWRRSSAVRQGTRARWR